MINFNNPKFNILNLKQKFFTIYHYKKGGGLWQKLKKKP